MAEHKGAVEQPVPAPSAPAPAQPAAAVPQMTPADGEFSSLMGTFRIFVILSILFDFFFIFTILSFVKKGELKAKTPYVSPQLQSEFNTWSKIFIIALIARVVLAVGCLCLNIVGVFAWIPFMDYSSYSYTY